MAFSTKSRQVADLNSSSIRYDTDNTTVEAKLDAIGTGIDADAHTYTQGSIGSVATTVGDKLRESVSVLDFGVVGNGIADDTSAIQAAIDYCHANGGDLSIPSGTYKITSSLSVDVTGGGNVSRVPKISGFGIGKTIIDNQSGSDAIHIESGTGADFAYNFTLENLTIDSIGTDAGTVGIRLDGCRLATISHVEIKNQASHGLYGLSSTVDRTDTTQIKIRQCQITGNGGYGIYASASSTAIQYGWDLDQCRIGSNTLGGVLFESMWNCKVRDSAIYYNGSTGLKLTTGGSTTPKLVAISGCEFDTNEGIQIDIDTGTGINLTGNYLIGNTGLSTTFTKGVVIGAAAVSVVLEQNNPRLDTSITGIDCFEFESGCTDVVVRDSVYNGYIVANGDFYVLSEPSVVIDDRNNRDTYYTGSYTVEVKNSTGTVTSPTTKTGWYSVNGNVVTVGFRNLNNIDISGMAAGDFVGVTLPYACISEDVAFAGNCIITSDSGSSAPIPSPSNGGSTCLFKRTGTNALLIASELTTGVSDISIFTVTYIK